MKLILLSHLNGNIDLVNKYADKSKCDAILCTGDFGMFYQFDETKHLPKRISSNIGNFYEYLSGQKKFSIPVITVYGSHENHSLVNRLIKKELTIPNFNIVNNGTIFEIQGIRIGGIGGTFSPIAYNQDQLTGYKKRHFLRSQVNKLKKNKCEILLMHDLIGECKAKQIMFSRETIDLFDAISPLYCFVGKYNWLGYQKIPIVKINEPIRNMAVVILPKAKDSYLILDTSTWDAEAITPDLISLNHVEERNDRIDTERKFT